MRQETRGERRKRAERGRPSGKGLGSEVFLFAMKRTQRGRAQSPQIAAAINGPYDQTSLREGGKEGETFQPYDSIAVKRNGPRI
jgi:hypothetical protein